MDNSVASQSQDISRLLNQRTRELNALVRVAQLINILDLDRVLLQTLQLIAEVVEATKGSLFLLDRDGKAIQRFITQRDMPPEMTRNVVRQVISDGLAGWCIKHKTGAVVADVEQDERWHVFPDDPQQDVRSALCVPFIHNQMVHGVITLISPQAGHFSRADLELVTAVAHQASVALRNAQLVDHLRNQRQQIEVVLHNTGEALLAVTAEFEILLLNPGALSLLGFASDTDATGKKLTESANPIFPEIVKTIQDAGLRKGSQSFELRDEEKNLDLVVTVSALLDDHQSHMRGYVIVIHDITTLKDFVRLKSRILQILTHDIRNPINVIWGYVDLLRIDGKQEVPADPRFIDGIMRALQRMDNLIEETLSADRLMTSDEQPFLPIETGKLIYDVLAGLKDMADIKKQTLVQEFDPEPGEIRGNELQIREAMVNLVSNAIKYTPEGGTITVRASYTPERFTFSVEDTGMGIPTDLQPRLFQQFYRALRPATEGIPGTGLGLNLVKGAVESHNGQVWFKSEEGSGSTFGFWLPPFPRKSSEVTKTGEKPITDTPPKTAKPKMVDSYATRELDMSVLRDYEPDDDESEV